MSKEQYIHPTKGTQISRQRLLQIKRVELGFCHTHTSTPKFPGRTFCAKCLDKQGRKAHPPRGFWQTVDWNQSDEQIMEIHDSAHRTVRSMRQKFSPTTTPKAKAIAARQARRELLETQKLCDTHRRGKHPPKHLWNQIDWRMSNADIAIIIGVNYQAVAKQREKRFPR